MRISSSVSGQAEMEGWHYAEDKALRALGSALPSIGGHVCDGRQRSRHSQALPTSCQGAARTWLPCIAQWVIADVDQLGSGNSPGKLRGLPSQRRAGCQLRVSGVVSIR